MKKKLLIFSILTASATFIQAQSPDWSIIQNSNFPSVSAGVRFLDAVSPSVVWTIGYDGLASNRQYNWFSVSGDGGTTFTTGNVLPDTNTYQVACIEGIDATTAFVTVFNKVTGNKGGVYKTIDAGTTWTNVAAANMYTNAASFANITCFTDGLTGITMGDPVGGEFEIHRTIDAGVNWTKIPGTDIPNPSSASEYGQTDVYTKLGNHIWFGTNLGRVFHSADAGLTWTVGAVTGANAGVSELAFTDNMNGICMGTAGTTRGLYSTTDGGLTWTSIGVPANLGMNDFCSIPGTNMYASCGAGSGNTLLSYSSDNGVTWTDWGSTGIQYLAIDFVDNTNGWAGSFSDQATVGVGGIYKYSGFPTSLKPLAEKSDFAVMPNPTSGVVNFMMPASKGVLTIEVIDVLGKIVYTENTLSTLVGDSKQLNLETLPKGLYTICVKTETEKSFSKIVLQ